MHLLIESVFSFASIIFVSFALLGGCLVVVELSATHRAKVDFHSYKNSESFAVKTPKILSRAHLTRSYVVDLDSLVPIEPIKTFHHRFTLVFIVRFAILAHSTPPCP